ncbi:MAG: cyclic nucleotide-binding/CBS domain-containing protein [Nitrospirales bacterium]
MPTLADVMITDLKTIPCEASVFDAARKMRVEKIGSLLVKRAGKLLRDQESKIIGLVSETDIIRKAVAEEKNLYETRVESIITSPMITVGTTWPLEEAYEMMKQQEVRYLLVSESEKIVGLISLRDILVSLKEP